VNRVQFLWRKSLIFVRGVHPHFTVCLRFSTLIYVHFLFGNCTRFSQPSFRFDLWGAFGPSARPLPLLRISFTAGLDFLVACLMVSVHDRSSASLKLTPRRCILSFLEFPGHRLPPACGLIRSHRQSLVLDSGRAVFFQSSGVPSWGSSTKSRLVRLIQFRPELFSLFA
jgi:hypothetical protein